MSQLKQKYVKDIIPRLMERQQYTNQLQVPGLQKIVINMGINTSVDEGVRKGLMDDLSKITGQYPVIRKARKSIAAFNVRKGDPVGLLVSLRGLRMYEFLERLIHTVLPRLRDFRGVSREAFDGHGNYTLGLSDQTFFPEINPDEVKFAQGMHITIVTTAQTDDSARELLVELGLPFEKAETKKSIGE